jgi:NAD(P)-dependent dehydrogenase (short-subunit alcohol dehydrogenase family)
MTEVADTKGPIDIALSGAAGNFFVPAAKMSPNAFKTVIDIDLLGTFNVLSAAYPHLKRPGAALVNITAPQAARAMQAHARSAKAGIEMLTRCLALECGVEGIRVNAVSRGPIADTEGLARLATDAELAERIRGALALPHFGHRIDIGNAGGVAVQRGGKLRDRNHDRLRWRHASRQSVRAQMRADNNQGANPWTSRTR